MSMTELQKKFHEIKAMPDESIRENISIKRWAPETEEIAERELRVREQQRTLDGIARSAEANRMSAIASEKAALANDKTAEATRRLVFATWGMALGTLLLICLTFYTGAIKPYRDESRASDIFIKTLKHSLPSILAELKENIRMIDSNKEILAKGSTILNVLFELEKPDLSQTVKYVDDTNVIISLNNLRECVNLVNKKIIERNSIYEKIATGPKSEFDTQMILSKENTIKSTTENCLPVFDRAQNELDQIHKYIVETKIKQE